MEEIKRKEIYYADLNPVKGSEQGGVRPVLVLQNNVGNSHSPTTIVAAITSRHGKSKLPTHVCIQSEGLPRNSVVLLEQVRTIDKTRLLRYVGRANKATMERVDRAVAVSLSIPYMEGTGNGGKSSTE